jgi:threonine-phosphate decarboxylase
MSESAIPAHGGQLRALAQQFGVSEESLLDFSASIHPSTPSASILKKLTAQICTRPELLSTYPEATYADMRAAIARYVTVHPDSIAVSNGVMSLLQATVQAFGLKQCLVFLPAFSDYERTLRLAGCATAPLLLKPSNSFQPDLKDISDAFHAKGIDSLLLANPHSPSGVLLQSDALQIMVRQAEAARKYLIIDEAFIDYTPQASLAMLSENSRYLVILRSLTKYFAIPGARVAYLVSHPEHTRHVAEALPLWPVDNVAALLAQYLLDEDSTEKRDGMERERAWLSGQLSALGVNVFPASANFLLFSYDSPRNLWQKLIRDHGVVVRACGNFAGLDDRFFRVAVRSRPENKRLISALRACLFTV